MTDFKQPYPKHNPPHCSAEWHLWRSPLMLAIYCRAGALTRGGTEGRTFFAKAESLAKYFGSSYSATTRAIRMLVAHGWLIPTLVKKGQKHYLWVHHDVWAVSHPSGCAERELFAWQETLATRDPLVNRLYGSANGNLRLRSKLVAELHEYNEDEVVRLYVNEIAAREEKRKRGDWGSTSNESCLWRVVKYLRERKRLAA